jgi:tRNA (cmo5U34)-methyltransferase
MSSGDPTDSEFERPAFRAELPSARDQIFVTESAPSEFRFDDAVARVFPDMLRRSIPGYSTLLDLIGVLSRQAVPAGSTVYDLGCSLGAVSLSIRHALGARDARIVAIDNSKAMVERCREVISADSGLCPVEVREGDIASLELEPASLVVLNFTLQFAPLEQRAHVVGAIAEKLLPGGALVLSEKTASEDAAIGDFYAETHDSFRESNGYSRLEMSRKREALERFLVPEAAATHVERMRAAGLVPVEWFRCLHFVSWVARKPR